MELVVAFGPGRDCWVLENSQTGWVKNAIGAMNLGRKVLQKFCDYGSADGWFTWYFRLHFPSRLGDCLHENAIIFIRDRHITKLPRRASIGVLECGKELPAWP